MNHMKAVILAAGKGVRMLPLTIDKPKVLIEINGKPFLWYVLENLKKAGVTEYAIIANHQIEKMREFLAQYGIQATLLHQPEPLGTADAVKQAQSFCGQDNFMIVSGDNLYSVEDLKAIQKKDTFCYIVGKEVEDWQRYGVLVVDEEKLVKIVEKPTEFVGNLVNVGLYKCTADIWPALDKIGLSPRGEYEFTDALTILAKEGKVKVLKLQKYWLDLGCKEDVGRIGRFLKSNKDFT